MEDEKMDKIGSGSGIPNKDPRMKLIEENKRLKEEIIAMVKPKSSNNDDVWPGSRTEITKEALNVYAEKDIEKIDKHWKIKSGTSLETQKKINIVLKKMKSVGKQFFTKDANIQQIDRGLYLLNDLLKLSKNMKKPHH